MGKIGCGYGSEWHLLRYMGRHRQQLDREILTEIKTGDRIEWLDFGFDQRKEKWYDAELKGLAFLEDPEVLDAWTDFWPANRNWHKQQNWDAVGRLIASDRSETLLLVEAKAHTGELKSDGCGAGEKSRVKIEDAFEKTIKYLKNTNEVTRKELEYWCGAYYQYANRLAALYFLRREKVKARLVLIYFCRDKFPNGQIRKGKDDVCPTDKETWKKALDAQDEYLGLRGNRRLTPYIHKVYLSVTG